MNRQPSFRPGGPGGGSSPRRQNGLRWRLGAVGSTLAAVVLAATACGTPTPASTITTTTTTSAPVSTTAPTAPPLVANETALIAQAVATVKADELVGSEIWDAATPTLARAPVADQAFAALDSGQALFNDEQAYAGVAAAHQTVTGVNQAVWATAIPGTFELVGNTPKVDVAVCFASAQIFHGPSGAPLPGPPGELGDSSGVSVMKKLGTWKEVKALDGPGYPYTKAANACPGYFILAQQQVVEGKI